MLSKTPDQQVAVITHFRDLKTAWPESIREAHLTITRVSVKGKPPFSTEWKGRVLDQKFSDELTQALETAAADGKPFSVYTQIGRSWEA